MDSDKKSATYIYEEPQHFHTNDYNEIVTNNQAFTRIHNEMIDDTNRKCAQLIVGRMAFDRKTEKFQATSLDNERTLMDSSISRLYPSNTLYLIMTQNSIWTSIRILNLENIFKFLF